MSRIQCESRQDTIAALVLGHLGPTEEAEIRAHLAACRQCQSFYRELLQEEDFLEDAFAAFTQVVAEGPRNVPDRPARIITLPRRRLARWAVAAVLVMGIIGLLGRHQLTSVSYGAAFGDVLREIQKARSVSYTKVVMVEGQEPFELREMARDPGRFRSDQPNGRLYIADFVRGQELSIDPRRKIARLTYEAQHDKQRLCNYLDWLDALRDADGQYLGRQDLDGQPSDVFSVNRPFERITIWTDPQTNLPVRVERTWLPSPEKGVKQPMSFLSLNDFLTGNGGDAESPPVPEADGKSCVLRSLKPGICESRLTSVIKDFVWNVPLDEELFQMRAPEGYTVVEFDLGAPPIGQQALLKALRFWAEASNGVFPSDINELLNARPLLVHAFRRGGQPEQEFGEALKMAKVIINGLCFAQELRCLGNWYYTDAQVELGRADQPLCWWRDSHSGNYRMVYGDLSVRDISARDLPTGTPSMP